jgi:hypothetical protein
MEDTNTKSIMFNANKRIKRELTEDYKKSKNGKRVEAEKWVFSQDDYIYENQLNNIKKIVENDYKFTDENTKISLQQINKKIYGYKQQDLIKKLFNNEKFIKLESIVNKMIECRLKCYYCKIEMNVLYDISREIKQWTVDRIDNDLGHNIDNYYLACLECNLKRRRRSDDKFLFTKQMKLVKVPGENNIDTSLV